MGKKQIRIIWSCSNNAHHQHRWKMTARLCGFVQRALEWAARLEHLLFIEKPQLKRERQQFEEDEKQIATLRDRGHSYHCACRMVWGDGECECHVESN